MTSETKERRRRNIRNIREARDIIRKMESYLASDDPMGLELADAFFQVFSYHLHEGDLRPDNVLMTAYLRKNDD